MADRKYQGKLLSKLGRQRAASWLNRKDIFIKLNSPTKDFIEHMAVFMPEVFSVGMNKKKFYRLALKHLELLGLSKRDPNKISKAELLGKGFYRSAEWLSVRYIVIRAGRGCCEACGADSSTTQLHVDHIKPKSRFPELALNPENLQLLCRECNFGKSNTDCIDWRKPPLDL